MGFKYLRFTSPGVEKKFNEDAVETAWANQENNPARQALPETEAGYQDKDL